MAGKAPRNKTTRSRPARPVQKRYPETRMERGVLLLVGAVIAIAAVVVLVGLYLTQYRPPRAHILTIEGTDYTAAEVKRRGSFFLREEATEADAVTQENVVDKTIERLIRDQVVLRRAPALVGEIHDSDIEQGLSIRLGFATPTATPAPSATPGATVTPTPAPTPTEVVTPDAEQAKQIEADFARARRDLYRAAGLSRSEFEAILKVGLLQQRLIDKFTTDIGATAPQVKLQVIRLTDEAAAQRIREQAVAGTDFVRLAAQNSVMPTARQDGGELGWRLVATLADPVRTAVESLPKNGISSIVRNERFFEIYKVTEATTGRELDATQRDTLVGQKLDDWFTEETAGLTVERDLSDGEREWLLEAIIDDARERAPAPTPEATPAGAAGG